VYLIDGMVGDAFGYVSQLNLRGDAIEFGRADQAMHRGCALAAAVGAGKQEVALAEGDAAQRPFGGRVVDLDAAVVGISGEGLPQLERIQDRRRRIRLARQRGERRL
jgi:hypothetical protein